MTTLLSDAFAQASQLPEEEQDAFARWLTEKLESDRHWDELLEGSQPALGRLAEALAEHNAGKTKPLTAEDF